MKKFQIALLLLMATVVFAACTPDAPVRGTGFTLAATNVYGAEAIPVAYDVYAQLYELLFSPDTSEGFDADFVMSMTMDTIMEGASVGTAESISTGNMRANIDGDTMQSAMVATMEMDMDGESMEMDMEMHMEIVGDEITFFRMMMDGEEFDDPMMMDMINATPNMTIPEITMDAILSANVAQVGNETHITVVLDATVLTDFVDEILGNMMGDVMADLGMDMDMDVSYMSYVIILDSDNNLARMIMNMDFSVAMEMDLGFGDPIHLEIAGTSSTEYTYNYIGNVEIIMPQ